MSTWKYMKDGQQLGPVDADAILAMLRTGTLKSETLVCQEGKTDWVPVQSLPEFSGMTPSARGPQSAPPIPGPASPLNDGDTPDPADVDKNKVFAVLAYVGILFLVPLLAAKDSRFARYHTNQGAVLFVAGLLCMVGSCVFSFIPFLGHLIWSLLMIGLLVLMIMGIINALNGRCQPLPLIGQFKLIK
jgi:uncharacterized membrane protein